ncbi:MAG: hypothetical protein PHE68_01675 [Candidatus Peribacteraceae bacterium]|nr:hypothetical protein [Candidatus Peribacteraceae bacterium]MDD5074356.1 hypothetical protein [Candidatus Peribacteraceae bacterium]
MSKVKGIVGHEAIRRELLTDLQSGNVSHAYLFAGSRHLGKMTLARWFALQLITHGLPSAEIERSRHSFERLTHPDFFVLDQLWIEDICEDWDIIAQTSNAPQQHRSKKPAARTDVIGIDDIRALQERLGETSTAPFRCCIIRSVERMHAEAANALLKILEEPPAPLVFLFTTQALTSLLPTVVSRMRVFRFHPLAHRELNPLLEGVTEDDRQFILHLAQGAPGIVHELKSDPETLRVHRLVHTKAISFWRARTLKERLKILEPLRERGTESDQLLLHLSLALREQAPAQQEHVRALHELVAGLKTNAHRQLLSQRFALRTG